MQADSFDYIIVGAGSAGCVLANRLSEKPDVRVLLVESGPPDAHPLIAMPMGIGKLQKPGSPYYWHYTASQGAGRPDEAWVKGRTLGGSSSINGMVYVRGMPEDYDCWERDGATGWNWATMSRCFREMEDHELGATATRGAGGPLRVSMGGNPDSLNAAVIEAAAQAGAPSLPDINDEAGAKSGGFGRQPRTISKGRRFSAADAFLRPALKRANLTVVTETDVLDITFDGRRASGVRVRDRRGQRHILARREVILCAGALNSPKLLQLSGVGPAELLRALGLAVRVDLPNVGRNLREHRTISIGFRLERGGHNGALRGCGAVWSALRYALLGRGALTGSTFSAGGFVKTLPGLDRPDGQIGLAPFSFDAHGVNRFPGMTLFGYFMRPDSLGETKIISADPAAAPYINANYLATERDRRHTLALMRMMRRIAAQPALAPWRPAELYPGAAITSDEALTEAFFTFGSSGYHVAGTCRMGSDQDSVVDPALRVRGVTGLRVVDTSIMPSLSGNTNAPAMAIAWRAAEIIRTQA